jgi:hypothetical protein
MESNMKDTEIYGIKYEGYMQFCFWSTRQFLIFLLYNGMCMLCAFDLQFFFPSGWLSFSAYDWNVSAVFRAYTPGGRGMQLRTPALLPNITAFKGPRIIGTKQYQIKRLRIG